MAKPNFTLPNKPAIKSGSILSYNYTDDFTFVPAELSFSRNGDATIVNSKNLIETVSANTPRIDYSDSLTEPSLLLEPQRTNLIAYSEDFSQWDAFGTITTTSNYGISPDGTNNSTRIIFSGGNQQIRKDFTSSSGVTGSVYIKGNSGEAIKFGVTGGEEIFTLNGNWQRLTTYSASSTRLTINTYGDTSTARDIQVWGAQTEEGSYATSYIPTSGSTATRLGETANNAGDVNVFNSEEGVLYAELSTNFEASGGVKAVSVQYDVNNYVAIYFRNDNNLSARVVGSGNVTQVDTTYAINTFYKIAVSYNSTNVKFYVNGTQVDIDTTNTLPTSLNKVSFNRGSTSSLTEMEGKVRNVQVFNKALTDRELEILTIQ